MSQENVEVVRSMFAAYRAGDVEAVVDAASPDVELRPGLVGGLEGTVYHGREGFRAFLDDIDAAWEQFAIEPEDYRDLGDTVLVLGHVLARARDGMELHASAGWVCKMQVGKVARFQSFPSSAEALDAVGLSRQAAAGYWAGDVAGERGAALLGAGGSGRVLLATAILGGGLRVSEVTGLRWRDVNLALGTIQVVRSKTDAGIREVAMDPWLREEPTAHKMGSKFTDPDHVTFHSLRRTYASLAAEAGIDAALTAAQIGHKSARFTLDCYTDRRENPAERIGSLVGLSTGTHSPVVNGHPAKRRTRPDSALEGVESNASGG